MKEVDEKILARYERDQVKVHAEDKSFFLLPAEVQIKCHILHQKRQWVESVNSAVNACYCTTTPRENGIGGARPRLVLVPLWQCNHGRRPRLRKKQVSTPAQVQFLVSLNVL